MGILVIIAITIPLLIFLSRQQQDIRQRAAVGDAVTFVLTPVNIPAGQTTFNATLILEGKGSDISGIDLTIVSSDANKLEILGFTPNSLYTQVGSITIGSGGSNFHYLGVNSDRSRPIIGDANNQITLGTIQLRVKASGGSLQVHGSTEITRGGGGGSLLGITNTTPLVTYNLPTETLTPTVTGSLPSLTPSSTSIPPSPTPTLTLTPTPTIPAATNTPAPTAIPVPGTKFSFDLKLTGIGDGILENDSPIHIQRGFRFEVFDASENKVAEKVFSSEFLYDGISSKTFKATNASIGQMLSAGNYILKISTPTYLRRRIPGIYAVTAEERTIETLSASLIVGDINSDNKIDIADYSLYRACYGKNYSDIITVDGSNFHCANIDLNDDEKIDSRSSEKDYRLLINSFSTKQGD